MNQLVVINQGDITIAPEFLEKYRAFQAVKLEMDLLEKEFRRDLKKAMEDTNRSSLLLDGFSAVLRKSGTRTQLDTKKLRDELPDVFESYSKTVDVASSLVITLE